MTDPADHQTNTCPRCHGPAHRPRRAVITSVEDALHNDRIEFECEQRQLERMRRR